MSPTAAWGTTWAFPVGPTLEQIRPLVKDLTGSFGCPVLIDHRAHNALFVGALDESSTNYAPGGLSAEFMQGLALEDQWVGIWTQVMKMGANPPTLQLPTRKELQIGGARGMAPVTLNRIGFTTRIGMDPADFRGMESKLATALRAAPFVSVYGW